MYQTRILPVPDPGSLGRFRRVDDSTSTSSSSSSRLDRWEAAPSSAPGMAALQAAADRLRATDVPVGFPTETVYGLGADATRSAAVRGIFAVKGRPADNPLIVHVCDLEMLRGLLAPGTDLPSIYRPLVDRFWPGPLTILLPVPPPAEGEGGVSRPQFVLAPEVTAGLPTFGARLPASPLTCTLIRLAGTPLAGPSANASTRPSPTTARHVVDDLQGKIEVVLDGGACGVGVESTVVDGLCDPPVVLRPGGISLAQLRAVPGWEHVQKAYKDASQVPKEGANGTGQKGGDHSEEEALRPRAPGMKYKHYSPKARVVLYEGAETAKGTPADLAPAIRSAVRSVFVGDGVNSVNGSAKGETHKLRQHVVGVVRTSTWQPLDGLPSLQPRATSGEKGQAQAEQHVQMGNGAITYNLREYNLLEEEGDDTTTVVLDLDLGRDLPSIAHGLFSALRDLDARGADAILVEGVDDRGDDMAAAVMNRLRKAASEVR